MIDSGFGLGKPAIAQTWRASVCEADVDAGGERIRVCVDGYHMGVFWNEGSFVNGACNDGDYNVNYKGMSKSDAMAWVKEFCR